MDDGILFLAVSIVLDVIANLFLKKSDGFKNKSWGFGAVLLIIIAFAMLSQAVKTMDLSVAYALWGASGLLLTTGLDVAFYGFKLKSTAVIGIVCMMTGIVLIKNFA